MKNLEVPCTTCHVPGLKANFLKKPMLVNVELGTGYVEPAIEPSPL
jgi:hypothetical protein